MNIIDGMRDRLIISLGLWVVSYLSLCFICWDILNPIQWVIDLPSYDGDIRLLMLTGFVVMQAGIPFAIKLAEGK